MLLKGLEEEVYAGTTEGDVVGLSDQVAAALTGFHCEPDSRNIEYITSPTADYRDLQDQLMSQREQLWQYLCENGCHVLVPGSCMALEHSQAMQRSKPDDRYHDHIEHNYGTKVVTASSHINIGIEDPDELVRAYRVIRMEAALYLGLSAASPFRNGEATGSHSTRWQIFPQTPRDVPLFRDHAHFVEWVHAQLDAGTMFNRRHLWVSVRPNGEGTPETLERLELRICDRIAEMPILLGVTAMMEARVLQILADASLDPLRESALMDGDDGQSQIETAVANEASVARNSLDARVQRWRDGATLTAREWLREMIAEVTPVAARNGFAQYLDPLYQVVEHGNPAQHWLAMHAQGKSIREIVKIGIEEYRHQAGLESDCCV